MNDFSYFKDNMTLIVTCLVAGTIFGIILPLILTKLGEALRFTGGVLTSLFNSSYFIWAVMCFQFGLEIFLLQQWIFVYNTDSGGGGGWDKYSYLPLTVVIPAFFANIMVFIASCGRLSETSKAEGR